MHTLTIASAPVQPPIAPARHRRIIPLSPTSAGYDAAIIHDYPSLHRIKQQREAREEHGINLAGFAAGTALGHPNGRPLADLEKSLAWWLKNSPNSIPGQRRIPKLQAAIQAARNL